MKVVVALPPMFEAIAAVFPEAVKPGVIFTWGDTLYNPSAVRISPELAEHEEVHRVRQGADPELWWKRYLSEASFRYAEELPAHQAEYKAFCRRNAEPEKRNRFLFAIAARLAGPLYGGVATHRQAMQAILTRR